MNDAKCPVCGKFLKIYCESLKPFSFARAMSSYVSKYICTSCNKIFKCDGYSWLNKDYMLTEVEK